MTLTIQPFKRPFIWSLRYNWNTPDGLYYDPDTGEVFSLSVEPYVMYIGRLPSTYTKQIEQLSLDGT